MAEKVSQAAAALLAARQMAGQNAPAVGKDRAMALVESLSLLPLPLMAMFGGGQLVCGEISDPQPDVYTREVAAGEFLIVMTSGWPDFLYAVSRAMAGASVMHSPVGVAENTRALDRTQTSALMADALRDWRRLSTPSLWDLFWRKRRILTPDFALHPGADGLAESKATAAAMFMIAHELGHVALDAALTTSPEDKDELRADAVGMSMYLPRAQERFGLRLALDGAAFAIRVTHSLTRVGVRFTSAYPEPGERLAAALSRARAMCPSEQFFDEASTVVASNLELMDEIDAALPGVDASPGRDKAWQARAILIGVLQSLVTAGQGTQTFVDEFAATERDLGPEITRGVAHTLRAYYPTEPGPDGYLSRDIRAGMGQSLGACIVSMTAADRALFEDG